MVISISPATHMIGVNWVVDKGDEDKVSSRIV